jgi:hypothetical protein
MGMLRYDPEPVAIGLDIVDHLSPVRRSSSAAKQADAVSEDRVRSAQLGVLPLPHLDPVPRRGRGPRPGPGVDLIGILTVAPRAEHEARAGRLLDLLMDGLRSPPGRPS